MPYKLYIVIVLFAFWVISMLAFETVGFGLLLSTLFSILLVIGAIFLANYLNGNYSKSNRTKFFKYQYQRYPFDDFHTFLVEAKTMEEADKKAQSRMLDLLEGKGTVMCTFSRIDARLDRRI